MQKNDPLTDLLFKQIIGEVEKRLFEEGIPRIKKCLALLNEAEVWIRPNENSNSVGNLVLHLCGNVRQWIIAGLGKHPDVRKRQQEFDENGPLPTAQLISLLDQLEVDVRKVLATVTPQMLVEEHPVQVYHETGTTILIHVVEHFSYHVGQITYFVKARKDLDVGYYEGVPLE
ncbi:MAG: DUF1572 family protein [Bacteroidetes bacterium]|nr:DUF1572 family protein [Bacteroidota bacterium]